MENNMNELNQQVMDLATQAVESVATQVVDTPAVVEATNAAVEHSGMPTWAKCLITGGSGLIIGFLARMGWEKWITPKLKEKAFERKVAKEAKKAAKAAMAAAKNPPVQPVAPQQPQPAPVDEVDPLEVEANID